ncbi:MAG: hypothetical protein EZS28_039736, partial [Streblomastix strix]
YAIASSRSRKIKQIHSNANVAILFINKEKWEQIVIDVVARVRTNFELKKKVWNDELKAVGLSGPEDDKMAVILLTPRKLIHHSLTQIHPEVLLNEPVQYDKDLQIANDLRKLNIPINLTTMDEYGILHSRIMGQLFFHQTLGFWLHSQKGSGKVLQLQNNINGVLTGYNDETQDSYIIESEIIVHNDLPFLLSTWCPQFGSDKCKGPDDTSRVVLQVNVMKTEHLNIKEFYSSLIKK